MLSDPTSDGDAVGYLMHQAAAVGPQNSRELELSEKCAEYLRATVLDARDVRAALLRLVEETEQICDGKYGPEIDAVYAEANRLLGRTSEYA